MVRGFSEPWTPVCADRLRSPCLPAGMPVPIPEPAELEPEASTQARLGSLCGGPRQQAGTSSPAGQRVPSPCPVGRARALVARDGRTSASLDGGQCARTHLSPRSCACPHACRPRACVCSSLCHTRVTHTVCSYRTPPFWVPGPGRQVGCSGAVARWGLLPREEGHPRPRARVCVRHPLVAHPAPSRGADTSYPRALGVEPQLPSDRAAAGSWAMAPPRMGPGLQRHPARQHTAWCLLSRSGVSQAGSGARRAGRAGQGEAGRSALQSCPW